MPDSFRAEILSEGCVNQILLFTFTAASLEE